MSRSMTFYFFIAVVASPAISNENAVEQLKNITKSYFSGESLLFIYWSNVSVDVSVRKQLFWAKRGDFHEEVLKYWATSAIVSSETCNCDHVTDDLIMKRSYVKNTVVFFGDLVPEERNIRRMKQCMSWNSRSKILAIVSDSYDVQEILTKIWAMTKAMKVTVMALGTSSVKYYTTYPYENFKMVELTLDGLFPPKQLGNLHGSVIKHATVGCDPYVLSPITPNVYHDGLEIRILKYMAEKFNFKTQLVRPPPGENPFVVLSKDKRKTVGNIGLLDRCEIDFAIHGVQIRSDRYLFADYTAIHSIDSMVWVVPIRPFTFNWKSIIDVFQNDLWGLLFISLISSAITLYFVTKYETNSPWTSYNVLDAFFQSYGMYLSVPIHFYRKSQLYRLFLFGFSYFTMIIIALYQSGLITYLTTRGSKDQYRNIEEAVDDGLIGFLFPSAIPSYNVTDHALWNKILSPGRHVFMSHSPTILRLVAMNKTGYTMIMKGVVNFEVQKNLLDENHKSTVRILPEIYLPYLATIMTSKGHPLRELFRDNIMRLLETGILDHWMRDIILKNLKFYKGAKSEVDGDKALSLEQLKGVFYILPVLFSGAGLVFICEVVYNFWAVRKWRRWSFGGKIWKSNEIFVCTKDTWILKREIRSSY